MIERGAGDGRGVAAQPKRVCSSPRSKRNRRIEMQSRAQADKIRSAPACLSRRVVRGRRATSRCFSSHPAMVHVRLNERETNPNPHVNFITPLQLGNAAAEDDARQLLRALAAQVRPLMKAHGFAVNSLEEVITPPSHNMPVLLTEGRSTNTIGSSWGATGTVGKQWVSMHACRAQNISRKAHVCNSTELVLRSQNGNFLPTPYLMSTLCHEVSRLS